jgi:hypothetical protein
VDLNRLTGFVQTLVNGGSQDQGACTENYAFKDIGFVMVMGRAVGMAVVVVVMPAWACLGKSRKQGCYEYGYRCKGDLFFHGVLLGWFQA